MYNLTCKNLVMNSCNVFEMTSACIHVFHTWIHTSLGLDEGCCGIDVGISDGQQISWLLNDVVILK